MPWFRRNPDFIEEVRRLLDTIVDPSDAVTHVDEETIRVGDLVIGLSNLRARWNRLPPQERAEWLEQTLPGLVSPPTIPPRLETTQHLRPGIRPRSMLESARLANLSSEISQTAGTNGNENSNGNGANPLSGDAHFAPTVDRSPIPFQPFGGDLVTVLLWDAPSTMSVVNQLQLEDWGARFEDLLPVAIDNLEDQPTAGWRSDDGRLYVSQDADDYDGARLLVPGFLEQTGLSGELVVINPNRSTLIAVAVDDTEGIRQACELALEDLDAPSPISFQPLVGQAGDWRPLALPPSHPGFLPWRRLTCLSNDLNYRGLTQPLQHLMGDDLTLASYQMAEGPEGIVTSYTTWIEGVPSLLPKTDFLALVTKDGTSFTAGWDDVHRLVGTVMEPTDHFPELWRVMSFPDTSAINRLRNLSSS